MVCAFPVGAAEPFKEGTIGWSFSVGYGKSFSTDLSGGNVDEDITFVPFLVSRSKVLRVFPGGGSWGYAIEGFLAYARQEGSGRYGIGITPLLFYNFRTRGRITPYAEAGVGVVATNLDPDQFGSDYGFTPQAGFGIQYTLRENRMIRFGYRYHHISNAGLKRNNHGIDTNMILVGYTILY